jgi:hypothetical protein
VTGISLLQLGELRILYNLNAKIKNAKSDIGFNPAGGK